LKLLEFVATELAGSKLLVLGTYRDTEISRGNPPFGTLGSLTRQRLFRRVLLRGLTEQDTGRLIEAAAGAAPPAALTARLYKETEGNPFFAGEMVRLPTEEAVLGAGRVPGIDERKFRVPEGIRD
jgi:predicted ATPase